MVVVVRTVVVGGLLQSQSGQGQPRLQLLMQGQFPMSFTSSNQTQRIDLLNHYGKHSSRRIHDSSFVSFFKINRAIMEAISVINLTIIGTVKELTSIKLIAFSKFSSVFFINFTLVWNITIFGFV